MKILIHGINFAPELTGIGKYTGELAAWLSARGHSVRVVTTPPYYPQWQVQPGYKAWVYRREQWQGVDVWRCPLWVPTRPGGLKRLLHHFSFCLSSLPGLLAAIPWRPELVLSIAPSLFCAPFDRALATITGARSWLHIQDFEIDAAFELGMLSSLPAVERGARLFESGLLRSFDVCSTISRKMLERAIQKGVAPANVQLFPNWVDTREIAPVPASAFRAEWGLSPEDVVVLYSGNMGRKQGLEILASVVRLLEAQRRIQFVFCGAGSMRGELVEACRGLSGVRFLPLQPVERLNDLLNAADIHLLPQSAGAADLVLPSKLLGMLASARPVIATAAPGTELARIVASSGVLVPPGDAQSMADAILDLSRDAQTRQALGRKGRLIAEAQFSKDAVLGEFERQAKQLISNSGSLPQSSLSNSPKKS